MSKLMDFKASPLGRVLWYSVKLLDRFLCLIIYGNFKNTISAYLGQSNPNCKLCIWLSKYIEQDHCIKAAKTEGLIKE